MITRNQVLVACTAGALLVVSGCALRARSDSDPKLSVASCHNYAFADPEINRPETASAFSNPLNEKRLRDAITANFAQRGLPMAGEGVTADCAVGYAIGSRLAPDPSAPRFSWGLGMGWGGWGHHGMGGSVAWSAPYDYREGRVAVDLYDVRSHQAIWHAYVDEDVTQLTGADAERRIKAAVAAIFEKFPAGAAAAPKT